MNQEKLKDIIAIVVEFIYENMGKEPKSKDIKSVCIEFIDIFPEFREDNRNIEGIVIEIGIFCFSIPFFVRINCMTLSVKQV